jgi:LysM repeat protein
MSPDKAGEGEVKPYRLLVKLAIAATILFLAATTVLAEEEPVHVVQPGETLYEIALQYNMTTPQLAELNDIENPRLIHSGQRLMVTGLEELLAENQPIVSDEPWWGTVIVGSTPIRPVPYATGNISDSKRLSLDTILYATDTVQVVKTVPGRRSSLATTVGTRSRPKKSSMSIQPISSPGSWRNCLHWTDWGGQGSGLRSIFRNN